MTPIREGQEMYFRNFSPSGCVVAGAMLAVMGAFVGCDDGDDGVRADPSTTPTRAVATPPGTELEARASAEIAGLPVTVTPMMPEQLRAGQATELQYKVTNHTDRAMQNVVLVTRSENFRFRGGDAERQGDGAEGGQGEGGMTQRHRVGQLGPEQEKTVTVRGVAPSVGPVDLCVTVEADAMVCSSLSAVKPELSLTSRIVDADGEAVEGMAYVCDEVFIEYTVTNDGTGETGEITLSESLADGFTLAGASDWSTTIGSVSGGESRTLDPVRLQVDRPRPFPGSEATATNGRIEAQASSDAALRFVRPELSVSVDAPDRVYLGQERDIRVTVQNVGDVPALETVVSVEGLGVEARELGRLEPGKSKSFSISTESMEIGRVEARAVAAAYCAADAATATLGLDVVGLPALQLEVIDEDDTFDVGEAFSYEITVLNEGTARDLQVGLKATLPAGMEFVSGDGPSEVTAEGQNVTIASLPELEAGEEAVWTVDVRPTQPGKFQRFRVELNSEALSKPIRESEPTTIY
jgi:uncharacterized repeat protein (TIGR01451 family)